MKNFANSLLILILFLTFTACSGIDNTGSTTDLYGFTAVSQTTEQNSDNISTQIYVTYDSDDEDASWDLSKMSYVTFKGNSITFDGEGGVVDGNQMAITSGGTYFISGTLDDGQIIVKAEDPKTVKLVLYGVDITCSNSSPIYVYKASKTVITLADGTENYITDGDTYIFADSTSDEPNAAIFSKDDLTFNGSGSLTVNANYNNGIQSKDDLKITGGNIEVTSVNDAVKGRDSIAIKNANITINAGGDGLQSTNDEDSAKGYIAVEGGALNITSVKDGIQAETTAIISGGDICITSGGGSASSSKNTASRDNMQANWGSRPGGSYSDNTTSTISTKGIKAGADIIITAGAIQIDSCDDSINANDSVMINGGNIILASGDDGIHADVNLEINGGELSIMQSYEGMESAAVTLNAGNIHIISRDDGINVIGGEEGFAMGRPPGGNAGMPGNPPSDNGTSMGGRRGRAGSMAMNPPSDNMTPMGGPPSLNNSMAINPPSDNMIPMGGPPSFNDGMAMETPSDNMSPMGGNMGQNDFSSSADNRLDINGGYLAVNAQGDGLDANGSVNMTGGVVIVNGPTSSGNGALDHLSFQITGGILIAAGSAGMAQAPGTTSTQYSVMLNLASSQSANTMIHIETKDGRDILTFAPTKNYQSVVFSLPELQDGSTYIAYSGGSSSGNEIDGLYSGGEYTPGTELYTFTVSSIVTSVGKSTGSFPNGGGGDMRP